MKESYSIKQAEQLTGISSENIRFYEKQKLIQPARSWNNRYRQYTDADIHTLKVIRLLRMLDMPLEEIRTVLSGEVSLAQAVSRQQERLEQQTKQIGVAIQMCIQLEAETSPLDQLDVDAHLSRANQMGGFSARWLSDWKAVYNAAHENSFVFYPDDAVTNPAEFSAALRAYAKAEHLELVITKESMYPHFTLDGVRYTAQRNYSSISRVPTACIYCERVDPIVPNVPTGRRRVLDFLNRSWPQLLLFLLILIILAPQLPGIWAESPLGTLLIFFTVLCRIGVSAFRNRFFTYNENGKRGSKKDDSEH